MVGKVYGYVRVSTREQNEARQMVAMREYGIDEKCIYIDKQSGKDFERPEYRKLMRRLKKADTLVIKSIDRLKRNDSECCSLQFVTKIRRQREGCYGHY